MNRKDEIRKELEEIAPFLAGLEVKSAFKVPKGYFDELPDTILESVSPLAELKSEQAFKVPKDYFKSLPDLVLEKVTPRPEVAVAEEPVASPQSGWLDDLINSIAVLFQPRYALRLATVAILLIGGLVFIQVQNSTDGTLAQVDIDPLEEEYGISIDDLNDEDLAILLSDSDLGSEENATDNIDQLLDDMLENLDDINDEDLESLLQNTQG